MEAEQPYEGQRNERCGAKTRAGTPCARYPVAGRARCRLHGGATPRGIASPHFRHGRYSKALPENLAASYEAARHDPELTGLREEVALLETRIGELLASLGDGEGGSAEDDRTWREIRRTIQAVRLTGEAERRRMVAMEAMIPVEEVGAFATAMVEAVRMHVADPAALAAVRRDMERFLEVRHKERRRGSG